MKYLLRKIVTCLCAFCLQTPHGLMIYQTKIINANCMANFYQVRTLGSMVSKI
jgi:hypothetical protein